MTATLPRLLMVSAFVSHKDGSHPVAGDLAERLRQEAASVICVSSRRSSLLRGLDMAATTWWRRKEYDLAIVGLYSGRAFAWGEGVSTLLARAGRPFVISLHGGALPQFSARHPQRVSRLLRKAAAVTAPSRYLQDQMRPYRDDIVVIPNPIAISRYTFQARDTMTPRLLWLRAFHHIYNPTLAVRVAARLRDECPDIQLTMVGPDKGDGSWQDAARAATEDLASGAFRMPGGIPNTAVPDWLGRGDIFLNTASVDNTPVSVIEAMACGLPIVSTNVGGMPYLLEDGHDALLVPPSDVDAMAMAVRRLLVEPGLAGRLSRNARRKAEGFDWPRVWPLWRDVLVGIR